MKLKTTSLAAIAAFALVGSASAAVLFTDNYLATSNVTPNDQTTNVGRQGGTLATLGYLQAGNIQIGNATNGDSNTMLAAYGGRAYVNYDFSSVTAPLEISFRGLVNSANTANWLSFSVGTTAAEYVTDPNADSILFRANGGTELWSHGSNTAGVTGYAPGSGAWTDYKVVLSDTAGTGSAWGTGGSKAVYYSNGSLLGTMTLAQLGAGDGYIGFSSSDIAGYDDLKIQTIPEPSAAALAGLAAGGLLLRRRRN